MKKLWAALALALLLSGCGAAPAADAGKTKEDAGVEAKEEAGMDAKEAAAGPDMADDATAEYHKISPREAYEMMGSRETLVVDVRTQAEYDEGHVEGAILVPNESIGQEPPEALPDKDAALLVYCRSGRRSKEASEKLLALGYQNVYDFGGILDWPYDVVKG